jgi:hypothetical protein
MPRMSRQAIAGLEILALAIATAMMTDHAALAAQGPGTGLGTASTFVQTAMAFVVYGFSAATILAAAVIDVTRRP